MENVIEYVVKNQGYVGCGDTLGDAMQECAEHGYGIDWNDLGDLEVLCKFPKGWKSGKVKLIVEYDE